MRLIINDDFDALVSAVLVSQFEQIDGVLFVHAKDIHDGKIDVTDQDIILNLPYDPRCAVWFDHHSSEEETANVTDFEGRYELAPSCARVIYNYYSSNSNLNKFEELIEAADKIDSAQLSIEDVENPQGWVLISATLYKHDSRSEVSDFQTYFLKLIDWMKMLTLEEILDQEEVKMRIEKVRNEGEKYKEILIAHSKSDENVIITDFRSIKKPPYGNKFLIYTLFPEQNISARIFDKENKERVVIACGHNVFKRDSKTDVGTLMKKYGGGGHRGAGTCRVKPEDADVILQEIVEQMKMDG